MRAVRLAFRFALVLFWVAISIARYGARRLVSGRLAPAERDRLRGEELATLLERLGATFVKFGQISSTRPDLLGPSITSALARLQDRLPPRPFEEIRRVLEEDLGDLASTRLRELDPGSVAAASVAQVHYARLDTGEEVAVKVQRPAARAQIERDLALLELVARVLHALPFVAPLSLPGAVKHFSDAMHDQLDFTREARNNRRFAANFAAHPHISVPTLYDELCTPRVLVMERIHGVRASEPEKVGGDPVALARLGAEAILTMVFVDGFVHADLHPGNIFFTDDGRVVLVDLGLVAEIPDAMRKPWCLTFMALAQRNGEELARLFYGYAPSVATADYAAFESDVVAFFDDLYGKSLGDVEVSVVLGETMAILRRHRVHIDPTFTVVNVALLVAEGLGKQLDPTIDLVDLAFPFLVRALAESPDGKPPIREIPGARGAVRARGMS